jgi:GTPase subunit of restriction endonuclease
MDGVFIPFIPAGTWLVASAFLLLLLLVVFGYHVYQRSRVRALTGDSHNIAELAARKELLQADVASLREWIEGQKSEISLLEGERHQQELVRAELSQLEQSLATKRQEIDGWISKVGELEQQIYLKRQVLEELEQKTGNLEAKKVEAATLDRQLGELRREIEAVKAQAGRTAELEAKHAALSVQSHLLEQDIAAHKQELQPLRDEKTKTQDWLAKARQAAATERETRITLQQEIHELTTRKEVLSIEVARLRGELGGAVTGSEKETAYADLLQVKPECLERGEFSAPAKEDDESGLLRQFRDTLRHEGYFFSERVIDAFHTSLKCHDINPLTVLAGVSGTGKTLLPMRYAEFMGMHRLVMAVQPRWDSPQDMFGFYNYLEKKYKASELSRSLVRMDPYNYQEEFKGNEWAHERMLLVLLDEMNLARTEYYFSEFLSKLELRRMVEDPSNQEKRTQAELELDAGPGARRFKVWVPKNIFFVGTMNEDETTQTLSDKVLDRSNVLRFGKPDEKTEQVRGFSPPSKRKSFLPYTTWEKWIRSPMDNDWQKEVNHWISDLNEALDGIGRPFGFRVRQAISTYVANYPRAEDNSRYKLAFADQVEQKILPKLRGLDMGERACIATLNKIASLTKALGDAPLEEAFRKAQQESETLGMFHWRGVTRPVDEDA